jgi:hypothetical protein
VEMGVGCLKTESCLVSQEQRGKTLRRTDSGMVEIKT